MTVANKHKLNIKPEIVNRIKELRALIEEANRRYYLEDRPAISDAEYDKLFRELEALEHEYPSLSDPDSPTLRVGHRVIDKTFSPAPHREPMLSLANAFGVEELNDFFARSEKDLGRTDLEYTVEYKFDGLSLELVYEEGKLTLAATRGDGKIGENVTRNAYQIKNIPHSIRTQIARLEVRGEVMIDTKNFVELNNRRLAADEPQFANARNAAAGSLRQLDASVTRQRELVFFAYQVLSSEALPIKSQIDAQRLLEDLGFNVQDNWFATTAKQKIIDFYQTTEQIRDELPYEIDGLVVKISDFSLQEQYGFRSRSPRWAVAVKFAPREAVTKLNEITIQVGRTGVLTPVAELEPVRLSGVLVKRATLHNREEIERKDIRIGDTVLVRRQGDVIPAVVQVYPEKRSGKEKKFEYPTHCPECNSAVKLTETGIQVFCPNQHCPARIEERIRHFVSKKGFDIESLGDKLVTQLLESGLVQKIPDLFTLDRGRLLELERMGEKSVTQLLDTIEARKHISLSRFIYALGLRFVGERTAELLADRFQSLDKLRHASEEELLSVEEVGPKIAISIRQFFHDQNEVELIEELLARGVVIEVVERAQTGNFVGQVVLFTGGLEKLSRDQAKQLVEAQGGRVANSISKSVTLVVAGSDAGSKLEKAQNLGIKIINESEFLARV